MTTEITALRLGAVIRWLSRKLFHFTPDAITVGYTRIYFIEPTMQLRAHEWEHVRQARSLGRLRFWWRYYREWRRVGYRDNVFEKMARIAAGEE